MFKRLRAHVVNGRQDESVSSVQQGATKVKTKTWETTVTRVPSWPEEARPLKQHNWVSWLYVFSDVVLSILPLYFILLGISVVTLNGKPTKGNSFGPKVEFAIELGPTLFPIVFAAVSGRSMKMIARFLAERTGATLGTLELLMASQSVWGTVESQLLMQRLTFVGANLLFLWALSPLGGQASLRLMKRAQAPTDSESTLRYLSTGPAASIWATEGTFSDTGRNADVATLYSSVLMAPQSTRTAPQDHWGNIKIPNLETLDAAQADPDGWIQVPENMSVPEMYSSLVGLPVVGIAPQTSSSTFTMESTYLSVSCAAFTQKPYSEKGGRTNETLDFFNDTQIWSATENNRDPLQQVGKSLVSFFIDTTFPLWGGQLDDGDDVLLGRLNGFIGNENHTIVRNETTKLSENDMNRYRDIMYVSKYAQPGWGGTGLNIANCSLSQTHVEIQADCRKLQCKADKIRKSRLDTRPEQLTGLDHFRIMQGVATSFPIAIESVGSSPIERFMANTSGSPFLLKNSMRQPTDVLYVDLSLVPPETFSRRFSLMLNTFYQLSIQPTGYLDSLPSNLSEYGPDTIPATDINVYLPSNLSATNHSYNDWKSEFVLSVNDTAPRFIGATTVANITTTEEVFRCEFAWLALLMTCATTILLIGLIALLLKRKTLGPEMFGFVTSMTYHNPYVKLPKGGSMLDAMERARLLRDMEVYVADVRGNDHVGHVAFAAGVPLRRLERGRLYS